MLLGFPLFSLIVPRPSEALGYQPWSGSCHESHSRFLSKSRVFKHGLHRRPFPGPPKIPGATETHHFLLKYKNRFFRIFSQRIESRPSVLANAAPIIANRLLVTHIFHAYTTLTSNQNKSIL